MCPLMGYDLLPTVAEPFELQNTVAEPFELQALFLVVTQTLQGRTDAELYNSVIALPSVRLF